MKPAHFQKKTAEKHGLEGGAENPADKINFQSN
jgi:hypothetical protein